MRRPAPRRSMRHTPRPRASRAIRRPCGTVCAASCRRGCLRPRTAKLCSLRIERERAVCYAALIFVVHAYHHPAKAAGPWRAASLRGSATVQPSIADTMKLGAEREVGILRKAASASPGLVVAGCRRGGGGKRCRRLRQLRVSGPHLGLRVRYPPAGVNPTLWDGGSRLHKQLHRCLRQLGLYHS